MIIVDKIKRAIKERQELKYQKKVIYEKLGIHGSALETGIYAVKKLSTLEITPNEYKAIINEYMEQIVKDIEQNSSLKRKLYPKTGIIANNSIIGLSTEEVEEKIKKSSEILFDKKVNWEENRDICEMVFDKIMMWVDIYGVQNLIDKSDYIKQEIKSGLDRKRYNSKSRIDQQDIDRSMYLSNNFTDEQISKYSNLTLLKKRYEDLLGLESFCGNREDIKEKIDKISAIIQHLKELPPDTIVEDMDNLYTSYEIENRTNLLNNLFTVTSDVDISEGNGLSNMLVHFFSKGRDMSRFEKTYREKIIDRIKNRTGKKKEEDFTALEKEEIKEAMKDFKEVKNDVTIVNNTANMELTATCGVEYAIVSNVSNQISASVVKEDMLRFSGISVGIGFDVNGVPIENIATISDHNVHSNQGLENINTQNEFDTFSSSVGEMIDGSKREGGRNEVVMFRNTEESTLRPSYFLCVCNLNIDEKVKKV